MFFLILPAFFCVVPSGPETVLSMKLSGSVDTISPYGPLNIVISESLSDSSAVEVVFSPQIPCFKSFVSPSKDTVSISFFCPLEGNKKYTVKLLNDLVSKSGQILLEGDSITFYTYYLEQEPNNSFPTSDILQRKLFGSISTVVDTDCYIIPDSSIRSVHLVSSVSQTTFELYDNNGEKSSDRQYKKNDTLDIPDLFVYPLYVRVFSYQHSSGGYYEIGYN